MRQRRVWKKDMLFWQFRTFYHLARRIQEKKNLKLIGSRFVKIIGVLPYKTNHSIFQVQVAARLICGLTQHARDRPSLTQPIRKWIVSC